MLFSRLPMATARSAAFVRRSVLPLRQSLVQTFATTDPAEQSLDTPMGLKNAFRARLRVMREEAKVGGGEARIAKQHAQGKLTARERIDLLFDDGTFREYDKFVTHHCTKFGMGDKKILGDGVITGRGLIDGTLE